jgi:hypothetical protein
MASLGQADIESESSGMQVAASNLTLKTKACRVLLDAWLGWRGSRLLPRHADIDPEALKWVLSRIGVIEVRSRHVAIYRVAGTALRDTFGFDPTGQNSVKLSRPQFQERRAYRLSELVIRPCGYIAESIFTYSTGLPDTFESIGLPLESDLPGVRGLVIFALESIVGRRWQNEAATSLIDTSSETFEFLDIGAGVPQSVEAPPGFLDASGS